MKHSSPSAWHKAAILLVAGCLCAVYWIAWRAPAVGLSQDDGVYLVTAKALATGKGYRIISLPNEIAQTKYPILFPLLLASIWKFSPHFPQNVIFLKTAPLLCALVWWWLSFRLLKKETHSLELSFGIVMVTAASPWVLYLSTSLLSETLFAAVCTGALILLRRLEQNCGGEAELRGAALLSSAAFLTRTAGLAMILAGLVTLVIHRQNSRAVKFIFLCVALCAPWLFWQAIQNGGTPGLDAYHSHLNYQSWNLLFNFSWEQKVSIVGQNVLGVLVSPAALLGIQPNAPGLCFAVLLAGLVVSGFFRSVSQGLHAVHLFLLFYVAVLVLWAWPPVRFVAPLLPILLCFVFDSILSMCRWRRLDRRQMALAAVLVSATALLPCTMALYAGTQETVRRQAVGTPFLPANNWHQVSSLMTWIRENTPEDAVLLGNLDPMMYLYTGRKSVRGFTQNPYLLHYAGGPDTRPLGQAEALIKEISRQKVSYVVSMPDLPFREAPHLNRLLGDLTCRNPGAFRLVEQSPDAQYRVYSVDGLRPYGSSRSTQSVSLPGGHLSF